MDMMLLRGAFALLILAVCACSNPENPERAPSSAKSTTKSHRPKVEIDVGSDDYATARKALQVLESTCGLADMLADLEVVRVRLEELGDADELMKSYGWTRVLRVQAHFRQADKLSTAWQERQAGGHRLEFRLGGGRKPGIIADDSIGREICRAGKDGSSGYLPVDALHFIEVPPLPEPMDFAHLFTLDRGQAISLLGEPQPDPDFEGEEMFVVAEGLITIKPVYRDGLVSRAFVQSKVFENRHLIRWMGDYDRKLVYHDGDSTTQGPGFFWISSTRLPRKAIDARKILGATRDQVHRYMGPTKFATRSSPSARWPRDGYMVLVLFDDEGVVRYLDVSFDGGIRPSERPVEIRRWMRLPEQGDTLIMRGKKYGMSGINHLSISFQRHYI